MYTEINCKIYPLEVSSTTLEGVNFERGIAKRQLTLQEAQELGAGDTTRLV